MDALLAGIVGMLLGCRAFATLYPSLAKRVLPIGDFGPATFPGLLKVNAWVLVVPVAAGITSFLWWLEAAGF